MVCAQHLVYDIVACYNTWDLHAMHEYTIHTTNLANKNELLLKPLGFWIILVMTHQPWSTYLVDCKEREAKVLLIKSYLCVQNWFCTRLFYQRHKVAT